MSMEDLLKAIILRSVMEIYNYFDINRDGFLSEDEFEFFIRRIAQILKEKQTFWRLFFQLLMQGEVREQFLKEFLGHERFFGQDQTFPHFLILFQPLSFG